MKFYWRSFWLAQGSWLLYSGAIKSFQQLTLHPQNTYTNIVVKEWPFCRVYFLWVILRRNEANIACGPRDPAFCWKWRAVSRAALRTNYQKCRLYKFSDAARYSNEGGTLWLLGILRVVVCRWVGGNRLVACFAPIRYRKSHSLWMRGSLAAWRWKNSLLRSELLLLRADQAPRAMNETGAAEYKTSPCYCCLSMKLPSGRFAHWLACPIAPEQVDTGNNLIIYYASSNQHSCVLLLRLSNLSTKTININYSENDFL